MNAQKLKLFPTTLKGATLNLFTGLRGKFILFSDDMKNIFSNKFQEYCKVRDIKEEIFKMSQCDDKNLEDYLDIFQYTLQKTKQITLYQETLRFVFLKGIREDILETLNLMGLRDVSQLSYEEICNLCK